MQPVSFFLQILRRISVFSFCALLLYLPFGCAGSRHGADLAYSVYAIDVTAAYNACVAVCSENTSLALVTRTGCLEGCAEARRSFPMAGKSYASRQDCLDALTRQQVGRDRVREMREWCDAQWTHVHNRKGCHIAAETFYATLNAVPMCGSDGETLEAYGAPPDRSLPETPEPTTPALQDQPALETAPPAPEAPAVQPFGTPGPEAPNAPATQAADPDAPVRSTQPAGPLIPPPYVPEPSSLAAPEDTPAPLPAIRDTPKYQKSGTGQSAPSRPGTETARTTHPKSSQSPIAEPTPAPTPPPAPKKAPATVAPSPSGTAPQASSGPTAPAPSTPVATPTEQPVETVTPRATQQPDPDPSQPEATPQVAEQPVDPAPSPLSSPLPTHSTLPAINPESARLPLSESEATPGTESATSQQPQGPPVPGLNANRPLPPSAEPSDRAPEGKGVTPPVPSMLDRPYNTPTIIAPQIDTPPEG